MSRATKAARKDHASAAVTGISPLLLGNCAQLTDLHTNALVKLSRVAECRLAHAGEHLFRQGHDADSVYVLLDGAINLDHGAKNGLSTTYRVEAPYAAFGDIVLLGEERRRYSATALLDSVVVEIPLPPLVEVLAANTPQAIAWRGAIMARLHRKEPHNADGFGWRILDKLSQLFEAA